MDLQPLGVVHRVQAGDAMTNPIHFFVAGIPRGQPWVRPYIRGGHASTYTPPVSGQIGLAL